MTIKTTDDYTKLPDGTILINRAGKRLVKGAHPTCGYIEPSDATPLVTWDETHRSLSSYVSWQVLLSNGKNPTPERINASLTLLAMNAMSK
jgi:hypothetical protein